MSGGPGQFAGKTAFGSSQGGAAVYLTTLTIKNSPLELPAMSATGITGKERCILYARPGGSLRIQMGENLLWIGFLADLGWLVLTADAGQAVDLVLAGNPPGQRWQVHTPDGLATVMYTLNYPTPILTINSGPDSFDTFEPHVVTPSLDQIRQAKVCRDGDLRSVYLAGQDMSGVDFTGASFTAANLAGAVLDKATLTRTGFQGATLTGVRLDGAVLEQADLSGAKLNGTAWGSPAQARRIVLTNCSARGATLGGQPAPLDCTGANLASGDFTGADLRGLLLTDAQAGGAILVGTRLDKAVLDNANLTGAIAQRAVLRGASLRNARAQGASFVRADLSGADLTRAQLGARAYLFALPGSFASQLDKIPYVTPDLVKAFAGHGVTLSPEDPVIVLMVGKRWQIEDVNGPYDLLANAGGTIDVFSAHPGQRPAVLRGAVCEGTRAPGANLCGADLRGVQWFTSGATLDHADLESASLAGSMLVQTDFTQAYLSGADLSGCVLVQAVFRACLLSPGASGQAFSLEGSQLQGADFRDATLLGGLLVDAAVALPQGVPLFSLPSSDSGKLTPQRLHELSAAFAEAGYPLGTAPAVTEIRIWLLDNRADINPSAPRVYRVQTVAGQLRVFDDQASRYLFALRAGSGGLLNSPAAPPALVAEFSQNGYSLAAQAPITPQSYWEIRSGPDAPRAAPTAYPAMRVLPGAERLPVYGSVLVMLRDWPQFPAGLAFTATTALESALDPASLTPSGYPRAWVDQGLLDWTTAMTAQPPQ
ncbi:MAG TPA: pentapeptide repeat-containing protein [Streptosporangiaceae bacterium]